MRDGTQPAGARDRRSGQAIIEFMVGIVAVILLIAGLLQVAGLATAHTRVLVESRRQSGELAMFDAEPLFIPDYIRDWREGDDGKRYTKDDEFVPATPQTFQETIINKAAADSVGWTAIDGVPNNRVTRIHNSGMPHAEFGFVRGYDSETVELLPAIQSLVYAADSIKVESESWMTWTKGIY